MRNRRDDTSSHTARSQLSYRGCATSTKTILPAYKNASHVNYAVKYDERPTSLDISLKYSRDSERLLLTAHLKPEHSYQRSLPPFVEPSNGPEATSILSELAARFRKRRSMPSSSTSLRDQEMVNVIQTVATLIPVQAVQTSAIMAVQ